MPQFEAQVPNPLREDLPDLLPTGGVRTPAIRILLLIFIGEDRLERSSSQVEVDHIGGCERDLGQGREEAFVDHSLSSHSNRGGRGTGWMGSHNDSAALSCCCHHQIGNIEQRTLGSRFRVCRLSIRRCFEPSLNLRKIEQMIVFASHDVGQSCQIGDNGSIAILSIQPDDHLTWLSGTD